MMLLVSRVATCLGQEISLSYYTIVKMVLYLPSSTGTPPRNQIGSSIVTVQGSGLLATRHLTVCGPHRQILKPLLDLPGPMKLQQREPQSLNLEESAGQSTTSSRCTMKPWTITWMPGDPRTLPQGCTTLESKVSYSYIYHSAHRIHHKTLIC